MTEPYSSYVPSLEPALHQPSTPCWETSLGLYDKDGDLLPASRWPKEKGHNPFKPEFAPSDATYESRKRAISIYQFWFKRRAINYYTRWGY